MCALRQSLKRIWDKISAQKENGEKIIAREGCAAKQGETKSIARHLPGNLEFPGR
jgi:hypothetical protein